MEKRPNNHFQRIYYETMFTLTVFAWLIHLADDEYGPESLRRWDGV